MAPSTPEDEFVDLILEAQRKALELRSEVLVHLLKLVLIELGEEAKKAHSAAHLLERLARLSDLDPDLPPSKQ